MRIRNNKHGSSIPTALAFFVIMAVMSVLLMTMGTVAKSKNYTASEEQRGYYLTVSALKLFNGELGGKTLVFDPTSVTVKSTLESNGIKLLSAPLSTAFRDAYITGVRSTQEFSLMDNFTDMCISGTLTVDASSKNIDIVIRSVDLHQEPLPVTLVKKLTFSVTSFSRSGNTVTVTFAEGRVS